MRPEPSLSDQDKSNQKINKKDIREVNEILEKLEIIEIWREHGTVTKTDHELGHRNMANKCKQAEIINATL